MDDVLSKVTVNPSFQKLNITLLRDLVTWAYQDEEAVQSPDFAAWGHWDQNLWAQEIRNGVCQTAYCIAGQAVVQAGFGLLLDEQYEVEDGQPREFRASTCAPKRFAGLDDQGREVYINDTTHERGIPAVAREVLGFTHSEGEVMFAGDNTIEQLVAMARIFAAKRGQDLRLPDEIADKADWESALSAMDGYGVSGDYPELFSRKVELEFIVRVNVEIESESIQEWEVENHLSDMLNESMRENVSVVGHGYAIDEWDVST